jgi:hypothetical protein
MLVETLVSYRSESKIRVEKKLDFCVIAFLHTSVVTCIDTISILRCVICVVKVARIAIDSSKAYVTLDEYHLCSRKKLVVR